MKHKITMTDYTDNEPSIIDSYTDTDFLMGIRNFTKKHDSKIVNVFTACSVNR